MRFQVLDQFRKFWTIKDGQSNVVLRADNASYPPGRVVVIDGQAPGALMADAADGTSAPLVGEQEFVFGWGDPVGRFEFGSPTSLLSSFRAVVGIVVCFPCRSFSVGAHVFADAGSALFKSFHFDVVGYRAYGVKAFTP